MYLISSSLTLSHLLLIYVKSYMPLLMVGYQLYSHWLFSFLQKQCNLKPKMACLMSFAFYLYYFFIWIYWFLTFQSQYFFNNQLRLTINFEQQLTEIENQWLRLTNNWDQQSTEDDNQLRLTINRDQQSTDIDNWLIFVLLIYQQDLKHLILLIFWSLTGQRVKNDFTNVLITIASWSNQLYSFSVINGVKFCQFSGKWLL